MFVKKICNFLVFPNFLSNRVSMSWNSGDNKNVFLQLKPKLGLHQVVLATPNFLLKDLHELWFIFNNFPTLKSMLLNKKIPALNGQILMQTECMCKLQD